MYIHFIIHPCRHTCTSFITLQLKMPNCEIKHIGLGSKEYTLYANSRENKDMYACTCTVHVVGNWNIWVFKQLLSMYMYMYKMYIQNTGNKVHCI